MSAAAVAAAAVFAAADLDAADDDVSHQTPAIKKSSAPRAGSHIGVLGSGRTAAASSASWAVTAAKTLLKRHAVKKRQAVKAVSAVEGRSAGAAGAAPRAMLRSR
jgi:hypothetical protein